VQRSQLLLRHRSDRLGRTVGHLRRGGLVPPRERRASSMSPNCDDKAGKRSLGVGSALAIELPSWRR
jgi:hypothetical protein